MQTTKFVKQPVAVSVIVEKDGRVFPRKFLWKDDHTYKIDRIPSSALIRWSRTMVDSLITTKP